MPYQSKKGCEDDETSIVEVARNARQKRYDKHRKEIIDCELNRYYSEREKRIVQMREYKRKVKQKQNKNAR